MRTRRQGIQEAELRRLYAEGLTIKGLVAHFNCDRTTIRLRMAECGIAVRMGRPELPRETRQKILGLYRRGSSIRAISRECGFTPATVRKVVQSENLLCAREEARQARIATALKRLEAGDRVIDIANDMGVTRACIYEWGRNAGWKRTKR